MQFGNTMINNGTVFNRFTNYDNLEFNILNILAKDESKHSDNLFKCLKYNSIDALYQPSLSYDERLKLLYNTNGDSSDFRVFLGPYIDDGSESQCTKLHIFNYGIDPINAVSAKILVAFDLVTHNKITMLYGDAAIDNPNTNPSEISLIGEPLVPYKNRISVMTKGLIAVLNGTLVPGGIGYLQLNQQGHREDQARANIWDGSKFWGQRIIMSVQMSGVSSDPRCSY